MKLYEIKAVAKYLQQFNFIKKSKRVANNVIELNFGGGLSIFFDLTRGNSTIYKAPSVEVNSFNAPFDTMLHNLLTHSKILDISTPRDDKIIIFKIEPKSQYKNRVLNVRFELTGKHTNLILTDEKSIVIEALHHIDSTKSYRVVKPGVKLAELLPFKSKFSGTVENIEELLKQNYQKINSAFLKRLKAQKLAQIEKKLSKLQKNLNLLASKEELHIQAQEFSNIGNILLANLHSIKPHCKVFKTYDFEGKEISIDLPKNIVKNRISDYYFNLAKRARNRAKNVKIEEQNLKSRLNFYSNVKVAIENCQNSYEIELLAPKQARSKAKKDKNRVGEVFWIEGYKVSVGRSSKENQELLKLAKSNDIWMHVRNIAGSHVFIRTDKQNLPNTLIKSAAKLCVDFSTKNPGNYNVDYTKRKFVKIIDNSQVEYDKYKTLEVLKEGIEIRE